MPTDDFDLKNFAEQARRLLETAILELLGRHDGLTNIQVAKALGLESGHAEGRQKNYLSWSLLKDLEAAGHVTAEDHPDRKGWVIFRKAI